MDPILFNHLPGYVIALIVVLAVWSITIKGIALYRAGKLQQKGWFVALLLINTAGILELIYLFGVPNNSEK